MYTPIRHWALAGEIVDLNFFIRPRVTIETKFGEKVLVNFHLDASRAKFFNWTDLKVGRSMVILYAVNRTFMDSNNGIRQENPDTVMVFPTSLQKLMSEFQHHEAFEQNNTKECFSCGSPEIDEHKLMKCTSCKKAFYCNKECQQPHWKASHKHLCKHALMISKLAGLDFSTFNGFTDWSFPNIDPMTAEEKEARSKEMHRDALYRMGAAVGSVPDRLDELLSSIEGKNLEEVISTSNMLRMLNEGDLPATAGETFIVESLRKFQAAISQDPKLREYVVDLSNQHGTDQRVHHMTSDTLLSMIFYILPLWQHEESVGAISWAFESHWPVSMFKGVYEDKSIWFTKGDYDSFLVKNRVADTSAFLSDETWLIAEVAEGIARANTEHVVIRILRATTHEVRQDMIREIASKEDVPTNMYTLWIREEIPGFGIFNPQRPHLSVVDQLLDVRHNSAITSLLQMLGVPQENILRPELSDDDDNEGSDKQMCSSCGESKFKNEFSKSQLRKYGRDARCKDCIFYSHS